MVSGLVVSGLAVAVAVAVPVAVPVGVYVDVGVGVAVIRLTSSSNTTCKRGCMCLPLSRRLRHHGCPPAIGCKCHGWCPMHACGKTSVTYQGEFVEDQVESNVLGHVDDCANLHTCSASGSLPQYQVVSL